VATIQVRIISDIHYGDRVSAVSDFAQLAPLLGGTSVLLFNGDTIDTRSGPYPDHTRQIQQDLHAFRRQSSTTMTFLTGNHDPDISPHHFAELAGGEVLVTHGDILFPNIVPWGRDANLAQQLVDRARDELPPDEDKLTTLLRAHRNAAANIPQRHQAERNGLRYLTGFVTDTIWPPSRPLHILNSWRTFPRRAQELLRTHRPKARFLVAGHTHWPGIWRRQDGGVIINTGSFCPPCGRLLVELSHEELIVRRLRINRGDFHPGRIIAQFALTPAPTSHKQEP